MDQRTAFLIQVLEKIGAPLTASVTLSTSGGTAESSRLDAQRVAELLNRSVQLGLSMSESMDIRDDSGQADGIRLSLASFASPLVAGHFASTGKAPTDADLKRWAASLQAVLNFADTFSPAAESTVRLQSIEAGIGDESLITVQMLQAFTPIMMAVMDYAFGKPEKKLIHDIGEEVLKKSAELRSDLFGDEMNAKLAKQMELFILRALCGLYVSCHLAETRRVAALDSRTRDVMSLASDAMDAVWENFEIRVEMLRILGRRIIDGPAEVKTAKEAEGAQKPAAGSQKPAEPAKDESKKPETGKANPMSFFKKSG